MKEKPKQRCALCGKLGDRSNMNREHFVPGCLWTKKPARMRVVPVHKKCNEEYSADDEYFRNALIAMRGTESHPEAKRVLDGPIKRVMKNHTKHFLDHLKNLEFASIQTENGLYLGKALTFKLDQKRFLRVLQKIVKGLYFCMIGSPVPKSHTVGVAWENPDTQSVMGPIYQYMSPVLDFGDDTFIYRWIKNPGDDRETFWCLMFYKAISFFGATLSAKPHPQDGENAHLNVPQVRFWS